MKKILVLFLVFMAIVSCEKDDFCLETPVTPSLILRFYDDVNRTTVKSASELTVWAEGKDSLFVNVATDSLVIPLNPNANQTVYNLSKANVVEQFTIDYDFENIYVSRSCGFKVNFSNAVYTPNNTWFTDISVIETTIDNQNQAHVQVFH